MKDPSPRQVPIDLSPAEFRDLGHRLVDRIADHLRDLSEGPVNPTEPPHAIRAALGDGPLPETGTDPGPLLEETADLLFRYSLYNGHPRFFGYITSSPAPIGALGDLLAAAINPNLGGWILSPLATEIELQTVHWIADLLGYPATGGGLLVSGGNVANFVAFWAARRAKLGDAIRTDGIGGGPRARAYVSRETHTWIEKAADLSGLGTDAVRWIDTDDSLRMDMDALRRAVAADRAAGDVPFLVVGTGGTTATGAVDPLPALADFCEAEDLWFHVDGAYGAPAVVLPDAPEDLRGLSRADSVVVDPHKWLYTPLEAGAVIVRDMELLRDTFSYTPTYYPDEDTRSGAPPVMFYEYGPQNSRGFRALKVWLALRQIGREGYRTLIGDDIRLTRELYDAAAAHPELEAVTLGLSIATFRYVPPGVTDETVLDRLNRRIHDRLQTGGEAFLSNAVVDGRYLLRACIVNFRTDTADVAALPGIVARVGREEHATS